MLSGIGVGDGVFLVFLYLYGENALKVFVKGLYNIKAVNVKVFLGFVNYIVSIRSVVIALILSSYFLTSFLALFSSFKER